MIFPIRRISGSMRVSGNARSIATDPARVAILYTVLGEIRAALWSKQIGSSSSEARSRWPRLWSAQPNQARVVRSSSGVSESASIFSQVVMARSTRPSR